jgi:hypothetical protein
MAIITLPYVYTPGEILPAAYLNSDFQTIYNDYNGNIDNANIATAAQIALSKIALNPGTEAFNQQASSSAYTWASGLTTDTAPEITMTAGGFLLAGPGGSTTPDVGLHRSAAGTWQLTSPSGTPANPILDMNNGTIINVPINSTPSGRLYLVSNSPYSDSAATGVLYYGPVHSNTVALYNGTTMVPQTYSQVSLSLSSLTASTMYDIYIGSSSSTAITLVAVAWSGLNTPPSRGLDSYARLCENATPANLLVGSIYVNSSNQTVSSPSERFVSNLYNSVPQALNCTDTTASWICTSTAPQPSNGNTTDGVGRASFVQCLGGTYALNVNCWSQVAGSTAGQPAIGIGVNSTSIMSAIGAWNVASPQAGTIGCAYSFTPSPGFTYLQRLQIASTASGGATYYGTLAWFGPSGIAGNCNGLTTTVNN